MRMASWCVGLAESLLGGSAARSRLTVALLAGAVCLLGFGRAHVAAAQTLRYSGIDRATVRITVVGPGDFVRVDFGEHALELASPIGHGSGVILGKDGLVVTAAHVVTGSRAIAVHVPGTLGTLPADVVHLDESRDFAILHVAIQVDELPVQAPLEEPLRVRQTIFAIGYPLDATRDDPQSARGVISGLTPNGLLQVDMSLNPGNSGGPIVDENERVQGIVVARGRVEKGVLGMGLGVPQTAYRPVLEQTMSSGAYRQQSGALRSPARQKVADLVVLAARRGLAPPDPEDGPSARAGHQDLARQLARAAAELKTSVEPRLLLAALEWNSYVVLDRRGSSNAPRHAQAAAGLCRDIVRIDPKLKEDSPFVKHVLGATAGDPVLDTAVSDRLEAQEEFTPPRRAKPFLLYARAGPLFGYAAVSRTAMNGGDYSGSGFSTGVDTGAGFRAGRWLLGPYFRWQTTFLRGTVEQADSFTSVEREDSGQLMQVGGESTIFWGTRTVVPMMRVGLGYAWLSGIGGLSSGAKGLALGVSGGADLALGNPAWHLGLGGDFTWGYLHAPGAPSPGTSGTYQVQIDDTWTHTSFLGMASLTTP